LWDLVDINDAKMAFSRESSNHYANAHSRALAGAQAQILRRGLQRPSMRARRPLPVLKREFKIESRRPLDEIALTIDETPASVATFVADARGDFYEILPAAAPDLDALAHVQQTNLFKEKVKVDLEAPAHSHQILIPTIQSRVAHNLPTTDLESQLADHFGDHLDDAALMTLPLPMLDRVFALLVPRLANDLIPDELLEFLMWLLKAIHDRASKLFTHIPFEILSAEQLSVLDERPSLKWGFFADQIKTRLFDWVHRQAAFDTKYDRVFVAFEAVKKSMADDIRAIRMDAAAFNKGGCRLRNSNKKRR
jgi:hypothetical protein